MTAIDYFTQQRVYVPASRSALSIFPATNAQNVFVTAVVTTAKYGRTHSKLINSLRAVT